MFHGNPSITRIGTKTPCNTKREVGSWINALGRIMIVFCFSSFLSYNCLFHFFSVFSNCFIGGWYIGCCFYIFTKILFLALCVILISDRLQMHRVTCMSKTKKNRTFKLLPSFHQHFLCFVIIISLQL